MEKCNYRYSLCRHIVLPKSNQNGEVELVKIEFTDDQKEEKYLKCNLDARFEGKCILHCDKEKRKLEKNDLINFKKEFTESLNTDKSEIFGIKFPNISLSFLDLMIIKSPTTENGTDRLKIREIIFNDCTFLNKINISDIEKVVLYTCNIKKSLIIDEGVYEIEIDSGTQIQDLKLTQEEVLQDSSYSIYIGNSIIKNFISEHFVYPYGKVEIRDSTISNIQMKHSCFNEGSWFVRNNIGKLKLEEVEYKRDSVFELSECNIKELSIKKLHFQPDAFHVLNTKISDSFVLFNSNFSNAVFQHVDLCNSNIDIEGCNFIGDNYTKFSNVNWGKFQLDKGKINRDTLRQLKHVNDQQGNYIQANKFYSLEMENYGEEIKDSKDYMDKVIFFIGKHLSNFSQNWMLPIFWFFFLSTALFNFQIIQNVNDFWPYGSILLLVFIFVDKISKRISYEGSIFFIGISWFYHYFAGTCKVYLEFAFSPTIDFGEETKLCYTICFICFKLISILIGYHLVTALRFHTRRK
ncbi:MAG: hypothetical protein JXR48_00615 [Candidatus Delongbacteria bacterium]|nr:hypothetical protein [Candidatus Delongbacteria bacterium]